jgi:Ni/Co efflux regulator RcnB
MFRKSLTATLLAATAVVTMMPTAASAHEYGDGGGWNHDEDRGGDRGWNRDRDDEDSRAYSHRDRDEGGGYYGGYYGGYGQQDYYASSGYYDGNGYDGYYAQPQRRYYGHRRYRCNDGTTGTVIGAVVGGLFGAGIAGEDDGALGAILGGGAGALAGRAIDQNNC